MSLAGLLPTSFVDAGGENFLTVTVSPPQARPRPGVQEKASRPRRSCSRTPRWSWSSRPSRARPTLGAQALAGGLRRPRIELARSSPSASRMRPISTSRAKRSRTDLEPISDRRLRGRCLRSRTPSAGGGGLQIVVSGQDPVQIEADGCGDRRRPGHHGRPVDNVESDAVSETPQVAVPGRPQQGRADRLVDGADRQPDPQRAGGSAHRRSPTL